MWESKDPDQPGDCGRPLRIVIAADDTMCWFYQSAHRRLGHEVVGVAGNLPQADDICRTVRPDLLLNYLPDHSPGGGPGRAAASRASSRAGHRGPRTG
jgi:hypothetical protein